MTLTIAEISADPINGKGMLALSPMPGRAGHYYADLADLRAWAPDLVITLTTTEELARKGAENLPEDLQGHGILWHHLPIGDFETPGDEIESLWPATAQKAKEILAVGGKVLIHCMGGCGRSGMIALRILTELGEPAAQALHRLRHARPCAVETEAQYHWAALPQAGGFAASS